jgi:hypothetical protein
VDFHRAAEVYNRKPRGFYTRKDRAGDIKGSKAIYLTLSRLERRGLVAVPLHLRPYEWHLVCWKEGGGVPSITPECSLRLVRMCGKRPDRPLFLKVAGRVWELPNPVVPVTAWKLVPAPA